MTDINGNNGETTFTTGLTTDTIQDLSDTAHITLTTDTIDLVAINVLVNGEPISLPTVLPHNLDIGTYDITGPLGLSLTGINTKTQHISADNDFTIINNILQSPDIRTNTIADIIGDGASIYLTQTAINMYVPTLDPILTLNDKPIITTPYSGVIKSNSIATARLFDYNQSISIDLDATTVNVVAPYLKFNDEPIIHQNYPSYIQASSFKKTGGTNNQYLMADGSSLQYSANSGNSNFYLFKSHANTPALPVDDGFVYYNNSVQASATKIYISHRTDDVIDIEVFYNNLSTLNDVYIQQKSQSNNFIKYNISSVVIVPTQYVEINVIATSGNGTGLTSFGMNEPILVSFFTNTIETSQRLTTLEIKTQNIASVASGLDTNFQGALTATGFKTSGGTVGQFLKANGTVDSKYYNNIQYLMNVSPPTLVSTAIETTMNGTGLTTNNMSMTWTDAINYSRSIYISGTISHTVNTTLTIRFRVSGGTIIIGWPIILANSNVVNVPFTMFMNYTIKNNNLYTASCRYDEAGSVSGATHMYNATSSCVLGSYIRLITAQWGASSAQNSLSVQELIVKNNYVG